MNEFTEVLERIRERRPLVHCISNIVTANDCANLLLAVGASPMMAQALEEMPDIAAISSAAVLNCGTPDAARFELCALRGELANQLGQPSVLDPVGAGASSWRLKNIRGMLTRFSPTILRVNLSEARALLGRSEGECGVDSSARGDGEARADCAMALADQIHTVILLSGKSDFISNGRQVRRVDGGNDMAALVTGSGCMLSCLCGAFAAAEPDVFHAAMLASVFWKRCAETAGRETEGRGPGTFRTALMDAAFQLGQSATMHHFR